MDRLTLVHMDLLSCEPILRRMPNGELLIIAQCGDVKEPAPGNRTYYFRSTDNGDTWSRKQSIYPEDGNAVYVTEVMVLGDEITAFLTTHNGNFVNWNCACIKSHNNGYLWEAPQKIPVLNITRLYGG